MTFEAQTGLWWSRPELQANTALYAVGGGIVGFVVGQSVVWAAIGAACSGLAHMQITTADQLQDIKDKEKAVGPSAPLTGPKSERVLLEKYVHVD
jgi:hypothetical protein